jgi:small-conductance mechanosensitive channel
MPQFWQRVLIAAAMIVVAAAAARIVDNRFRRRAHAPEAVTLYRVLRRTIFATIVFVGVLSALLVVPQVRAIAGGVLASSAVVGLVIGFASQRVIGNAVAGILIAFSQPLRIGDEVMVEGTRGVVEEIALTYTWIRTHSGDRYVVPNQNIAATSILNSSIRSSTTLAEISVQVPPTADLRQLVATLKGDADEVFVSDLSDKATLVLRKWVPGASHLEAAASDLRVLVSERLKTAGIIEP